MGRQPRGGLGSGLSGCGVRSPPRGDRQVSGPGKQSDILMLHVGSTGLDRKQRAACARAGPTGARGGCGRRGRAGRAPRSSGEFWEGLLSLGPSRGNFGGATCVRCHAGARGGGGLPRSGRAGGRGRWHLGGPAPGAASAEGPEERRPEFPARSPRPGACVWEVCGFAFEVELLPCLNYVRAKP